MILICYILLINKQDTKYITHSDLYFFFNFDNLSILNKGEINKFHYKSYETYFYLYINQE